MNLDSHSEVGRDIKKECTRRLCRCQEADGKCKEKEKAMRMFVRGLSLGNGEGGNS